MESSSKGAALPKIRAEIIRADGTRDEGKIKKSLIPEQLSEKETGGGDWLEPALDMTGLKAMVTRSTILPQCARAYSLNIAGFGIGVRYKEDIEENGAAEVEFSKMVELIELLNFEKDAKEVFQDLVEAREIYGIAYLEVIRDLGGKACQIEFIRDTPSVKKTRQLDPYIEVPYFYKGRTITRRKRFRKYKQEVNGKTVYFKEFGDPRVMDVRDGKYVDGGQGLELEYQANEIIEFPIGTEPYGEVRWVGQILSVDGARKAERLNNNYFENGRHTPLMIMVQGGTLTDESFAKLKQYMEEIKGESGQHAFIVLETETTDNSAVFEESAKPKVEVKDIASILQKDELFQSYLDNSRRKVQSAFQLPDLYVGYTTDFNRATAQTAMEVTEKQVFQPQRRSLEWVINNRLFNEFGFQQVEAYFMGPDITNPDDLAKLLTICNAAGGLTPNKAKELALKALGETSEDWSEDWGNVPLAVTRSKQAAIAFPGTAGTPGMGAAADALNKAIKKAQQNSDDEIIPVLKEIRALLKRMDSQKVDSND